MNIRKLILPVDAHAEITASGLVAYIRIFQINTDSTMKSRKKFLLWGASALASLTAFRFFGPPKPKTTETVKMLTRDGQLVEVDKSLLSSNPKKISNTELRDWIKKTNPQKN